MAEETKKLFHEDVYKIEFEANVVEKYKEEQGFVFVLDQTCFYPESGGQPSDKGMFSKKMSLRTKCSGRSIGKSALTICSSMPDSTFYHKVYLSCSKQRLFPFIWELGHPL